MLQLEPSLSKLSLTDNQFRDKETIEASKRASRFAKHYQPITDVIAQQNKLVETQRSHQLQFDKQASPVFFTHSKADLTAVTSVAASTTPSPIFYSDTFRDTKNQFYFINKELEEPKYYLTQQQPTSTTAFVYEFPYQVTLPKYMTRFKFDI